MAYVYYRQGGGPVLSNIEAVVVFFGAGNAAPGPGDWKTDPTLRDQACSIMDFFRDITQSGYLDGLAEYSIQGQAPISRGRFIQAAFVPFPVGKPKLSSSPAAGPGGYLLFDSDIQAMLKSAIAPGGVLPIPNPNRAYFVFLPSLVWFLDYKGVASSKDYGGYHNSFEVRGSQVPYAVVANSQDFTYQIYAELSTITIDASHEMVEMITDPSAIPGQGWYADDRKEIADVCENDYESFTFHGFYVAPYWSEKNQVCFVPPDDGKALPPRKVTIKRAVTSDCDLGLVENSASTFSVDTSKLAAGPYSYKWTVIGAAVIGKRPGKPFKRSLDGPTVKVQAPAANATFTLMVVVTDGNGCKVSVQQNFAPVSSHQAAFMTLVCEMRHLILANFRFNPIWKPGRDLTETPLTVTDIKNLATVTEKLHEMSKRLTNLQRRVRSRKTFQRPRSPR